jgi:methanogenic corrinoid protein MtbC1
LDWLRRVAEALSLGHRAAKVVSASPGALAAMIGTAPGAARAPDRVEEMLAMARGFDTAGLASRLARAADPERPRAFLEETVTPLLVAVGREWADGRLQVRHEHFVTQILEDVLRGLRGRMPEPWLARALVLSTLPGDLHGLGVQMVSVMCRFHGFETHLLGVDTPLGEIARTAHESGARAVLVGASAPASGAAVDRKLKRLRAALEPEVLLIVGGRNARGTRRGPARVLYAADLGALELRLRDLAARENDRRNRTA